MKKHSIIMLLIAVIFAAATIITLLLHTTAIQKAVIQTSASKISTLEFKVSELQKTANLILEDPADPDPDPFYFNVPLDPDLQDYIFSLSEIYEISPALIVAVIEVESDFVPDVISSTGDYGLMQINKINHATLSEQFGITDFLDPYQNVHAGIAILKRCLLDNDGDLHAALMQYNLGREGMLKKHSENIYETTYSRSVTTCYYYYSQEDLHNE